MRVKYLVGQEHQIYLMRYYGWIGFVFSNADHELYWEIDQNGDPADVELAIVPSSDVCDVSFSALIDTGEVEQPTGIDHIMNCESLLSLPESIEWFTPQWEEIDTESDDEN